MTDEELERDLRAWFRAEIRPDEAAPSPLRSTLGTIAIVAPSPWYGTASRRKIGLLAVAATLTTLLVGGALIGSGAFRKSDDLPPSDPALVIAPTPRATAQAPTPLASAPLATPPHDESSPTPAPTPYAPPAPCDSGQDQFLTGDARPTSVTVTPAELRLGRGVYVTVDDRYRRIWTVGPDGRPAWVVAATPASSDVAVLDISPDGSSALVRATLPPTDDRFTPGCSDLYLIRLDGSGATRLTTEPEGGFVSGAAFSSDGTRVAYIRWSPMTVTILQLATGSRVDQACETGSDGNDASTSPVAWSPGDTEVAAECGGFLFIVDPTGATSAFQYPRGDYSTAFEWADDRQLLVARDPGGLALRGLHIDSFDVPSRTATVVGRVEAANLEGEFRSYSFSPDGRWLMFKGALLTAVPMDQLTSVGYVVPVTGGVPRQVLTSAEADRLIGWSADGRALMLGGAESALTRMDVDDRERTVVGTLPVGYDGGVWMIP